MKYKLYILNSSIGIESFLSDIHTTVEIYSACPTLHILMYSIVHFCHECPSRQTWNTREVLVQLVVARHNRLNLQTKIEIPGFLGQEGLA